MKKLFIYIPTFNRLNSLVAHLNALIPQIKGNPDVRLHIMDNASDNFNINTIKSLVSCDNITIARNGFNIDGNANIIYGFAYSQPGEALWILSDNDIVHPVAVKRILAEMNNGFDLLCMRSNLSERFESIYRWSEGWSGAFSSDVGLISAIVYNVTKFGPYTYSGFLYHNTSFPHLAVMLAYAKAHKLIHFVNIERLFSPLTFAGDQIGSYSLSKLGMPLLSELMPKDKAIEFCRNWLSEWEDDFFQHRTANPSVFSHTFHYLRSLSPELDKKLTARLPLCD